MQRTKGGPFKPSRKFLDFTKGEGWSCIYFVQETDGYPDGPCKVGRTKNLPARLSGLQIGSCREIGLAECMFVQASDMGLAMLETQIHEALKAHGMHHRGEWFLGGIDAVWGVAAKRMMEAFPEASVKTYGDMKRYARLMERVQESWNDRTRLHDSPLETVGPTP